MPKNDPSEIEVKINLQNEDFYRRLIDLLDVKSEPVLQSNYFFDTKDSILAKNQWALRLRFEKDTAIFTLKGGRRSSPEGLSIRTEIEGEIEFESADRLRTRGSLEITELPANIHDRLEDPVANRPLELLYSFRNYRHKVPVSHSGGDYVFEIDRTEFPDNSIDYELEIEIESENSYHETLAAARAILFQADVPFEFQPLSKMARAVRKNCDPRKY